MALTAKQEAFCRYYILHNNGAQAAISAGYAPASAKVEASRLLTNVNLQARLDELRAERDRQYAQLNERIMRELCTLAFGDQRAGDKIMALRVLAQIQGLLNDVDGAIATLRRFGLHLVEEQGIWKLVDEQRQEEEGSGL